MNSITSPRGVKVISWGMIVIHAITPILFSASVVANTLPLNNIEETIIGLDSVIENSEQLIRQPAVNSPSQQQDAVLFSRTGASGEPTVDSSSITATEKHSTFLLPSLGSDKTPTEPASSPDASMAAQAMQAGRILSDKNAADASMNYIRSVGEGFINQQVNDWLNQKGSARLTLDSDAKITGDVLLPVAESNDSLLFTQLGMRRTDDRNTLNLGVGYRQYIDDWMYGVNTFYDYDYTGKNSRLGIGSEIWKDYLKFAANGYFALTDWHQSRFSDMRDYDERPANGFDIRANAWLPSFPQIGASLKYEQYFGKGVDLAGNMNIDDLKKNPRALTMGIDYTPIPLVTLKGEHSVGDKNETSVGVDFNYRFGIPWEQQISTESVGMLRSLMGSMREFVDRNYNIVMQYRKQVLLSISLPKNVRAQAAETITLPLTVTKAKYGLKDVEWTASAAFYANGGTLRKLSLTQLEVKLPAFVYGQVTAPTQEYVIKAVGVDQSGNYSNVATSTLSITPSRNIISALTITPADTVPANDSDYFTATAVVRDENNQPMATQPIVFEIANLNGAEGNSGATLFINGNAHDKRLMVNTDGAGNAVINVRSKVAKEGLLTATMNNGNYKTGKATFVADASTARIGTLDVIKNKALADGRSTNQLQVTVKDLHNNPVTSAQVELETTHNAVLVNGNTVNTDTNGQALLLVTNTTIGDSTITARINGNAKIQTVTFVADSSTAQINDADISATQDALANGSATNIVTAIITDANHNPVPGVNVHFSVDRGARVTTLTGVTGNDGLAKASVTSLQAGSYLVTARIQESGNSTSVSTRFIPDPSTATITENNLVINPNGVVANGTATDGVEVTVTDANGNLLPDMHVAFAVAPGATLTVRSPLTDSEGKARATVTSTTVGSYNVTATVNGHSMVKAATFIADNSTAILTNGSLRITADNAVANGNATNAVQARVTDANGNNVPGVTVSFRADNGATIANAAAITDEQGLASTTLTNARTGIANVTASLNGSSQNVATTFIADNSTATITDGALTVTADGAKADGRESNQVEAKVTDANGNAVPDVAVSFTATNGSTVANSPAHTNAEGIASSSLTNLTAGVSKVTASINGASQSVNTTFIADDSTATIINGNLTVIDDLAKADGKAKNRVQARVTDANGNPVPAATVSFTATNGATIATAEATTGSDGLASTTLTNTTAGIANVSATINGSNQNVDTLFIPDEGTATIVSGNMRVVSDNALANGTAINTVQVKVTDANGNTVPGVTISFSANNGASLAEPSVITNGEGLAQTALTNTSAGLTTVTAALNNSRQSVQTTFIADGSTATLTGANLTVTA